MKVLVLSCNTGEGHNSCGSALCDSFRSKGLVCEQEDALRFVSPVFSKIVSWGHTRIYRHVPGLFGSGYQYAQGHNRLFDEQALIYKILSSGSEKLLELIREEKYDTIVCTHVFSALMVTDIMRRFDPRLHTGFVSTDYTCSPSCGESQLDAYFIPDSTLEDEFVSCGIPREKIISSGLPVRRMFLGQKYKAEAREYLGLPADCRHMLVMCGSMGCGPVRKLMALLSERLPRDCYITVICGTNRRLRRQLERDHADNTNIRIYGFRQDVSLIMDSADLYLTKPGGISTSEAAAKKLPMVFVNAVAGCESHNMKFFVEQGAAVTADTTEELVSLSLSLLTDSKKLDKMAASFKNMYEQSPADIIVDYFTGKLSS